MVNIDEEIFISSEQLEISMKFGCMGCMFSEFASFCLCYNLGQ